MAFSRQEYWSGLPHPSLKDFPSPGIETVLLTSPALAGGFFTTSATWEAVDLLWIYQYFMLTFSPLLGPNLYQFTRTNYLNFQESHASVCILISSQS